jgi:hypothetical protein
VVVALLPLAVEEAHVDHLALQTPEVLLVLGLGSPRGQAEWVPEGAEEVASTSLDRGLLRLLGHRAPADGPTEEAACLLQLLLLLEELLLLGGAGGHGIEGMAELAKHAHCGY